MWKRLTVWWALLRGDGRRLWFALRHPAAPAWLKVGVALIALYLLSPIDFIPDTIPLLGVVDDIVLVTMAMRWLLSRLPEEIRRDVDRRGSRRGPVR